MGCYEVGFMHLTGTRGGGGGFKLRGYTRAQLHAGVCAIERKLEMFIRWKIDKTARENLGQ